MYIIPNFIVDECLLMRLSYTKRTKSGAESLMGFVWSGVGRGVHMWWGECAF